jgi:hypothetical protein
MGREFYFVFSTTCPGAVADRHNFFDAGPVVNGKMAKISLKSKNVTIGNKM